MVPKATEFDEIMQAKGYYAGQDQVTDFGASQRPTWTYY